MKSTVIVAALCCTAASSTFAQDAKQELQSKVAVLKESAAHNQASLRTYAWTAITEIRLKGEVKKNKTELCSYGPDGKVQKTDVSQPTAQKQAGRVKKKIIDKKVGELEDYMDRAVALIREYVPPSSEKIQAAFQAGNATLGQGGAGAVQLQFNDYLKPGDSLAVQFDAASKSLRSISVNSYLDNQKDTVTMQVDFQSLPDATSYPATTKLVATAKQVEVTTNNSNYHKAGS